MGLEEGFGSVNPAGIVHHLTQKLEELDALSVSGIVGLDIDTVLGIM